jgi:hypothetical protein
LAEIRPVTSEALEAQIRNLLPSQNGFGEDLQASNVITPIIDLTAAAQGTNVPEYQSQALAFGSQTVFSVQNSSATPITTPGFWRLIGCTGMKGTSGVNAGCTISIDNGITTKAIWASLVPDSTDQSNEVMDFDFIIFTASGENVTVTTTTNATCTGSVRQLADVNGIVINPSGFTPQ